MDPTNNEPTEFDAKGMIQQMLDAEINRDTDHLRKSTKAGISNVLRDQNNQDGLAFNPDSNLDKLFNFERN